MNITFRNYKMKLEDGRITLSEEKEVEIHENRIPTGKKKLQDITIGYGFTIEGAIQRIALLEIQKKNSTLELDEFLKQYKTIKEEIYELLD